MYPYQRPASSSSYSASQQQSSAPPPPTSQQQQHHQQQRTLSHSPEQSRSQIMGRNYHPASSHNAQHHNHQRGSSDMHEPRDVDERGNHGNRRWMDEQQQRPPFGPGPPSDRLSYPQHGPYPSLSHPSSPSHRPRTPPQHQFNNHRPSPWDPSQSGPMSAPPSLVPRINPNAHGSSSAGANATPGLIQPGGPLSHHTSPNLPSLMRGSKNHSRLPSWGPHSSNTSNNPPSRTDVSTVSSGTSGSNGNGGNSNAVPPFRGQSVGLGDPFSRSEFGVQSEKRKRPASESPPNNGPAGSNQQSSPTLRGDPMSMSSILGPSSRNSEVDKRRKLESGGTAYPIKTEGGGMGPAPTTTVSGKLSASNLLDSPASNLARRKWSGPIAEEAAQHAAAWRAQEQRWGSSRSPKVAMAALGPEQRQTPPIGSSMPSKRDNSPARVDGHKRQRSDGYQGVQGSPLNKSVQLRAQSPLLLSKQPLSRESSPFAYNQPLPHLSRGIGSAKPTTSTKGAGGFYRPATPPPQQMMTYQQQQQQQQQQRRQQPGATTSPPLASVGHTPQIHKPFTAPSQAYGQPSYHAYDSQGRPVEIDVDEVRGGVFAGHGNPPAPGSQDQGVYRHGALYNDVRHRSQGPGPSHGRVPSTASTASKVPAVPTSTAVAVPVPSPANISTHQQNAKSSLPGQIAPRPLGNSSKERESKRRSMTPNALGPAKGLLAPSVERSRMRDGDAVERPGVASRNFDEGPKVDSEAVWETLARASQIELDGEQGVALEGDEDKKSTSIEARHLGSFQYDPRQSPLLPGELLQANVGATLEVRISGQYLGLGPLQGIQNSGEEKTTWALGWRAREKKGDTTSIPLEGAAETSIDKEEDAIAFWNQDALIDRKLWGSDVYTDDSDVVAICLHSGWIQGPSMQDVPAWVPPGKAMLAWRHMTKMYADQGLISERLAADGDRSRSILNDKEQALRLERLRSTADLSVILRIAPKLIAYKGSQRGGVKSRSWGNGHDGVSLVVEGITLQESGYASGERGLRNVKHRIDHLARLKSLATIAVDTSVEERTTKKIEGGGLVDILVAASLSQGVEAVKPKPFWSLDVNRGKVAVV